MKPSCVYCGDAPVNHAIQYIDASLDITLGAVLPNFNTARSRFWQLHTSPTILLLARFLVQLLLLTRIMRVSHILAGTASKRTQVIWDEAKKRGIEVQQLIVLWKRGDDCRARLPRKPGAMRTRWHYFQSIPVPPWLPQLENSWVDDKDAFKKEFQSQGLRVARGNWVASERGALRVFRKIAGPVIVKPRAGSRARHTSVNITSETELLQAFKRARQLCAFVMIEEYIPGDTYRAICVDGKLRGVMRFVKASIIADGVGSCTELLDAYNVGQRFPDVENTKDDAWFSDALAHQGYTPNSIPPVGTRVLLAEHSERANGGYNLDITDEIPEVTVREIERGAGATGLPVVGFDLISKDLTDASLPFTFIEGNSLPFIDIHHAPSEGQPRDIAGAVWDMWFPVLD